MVDLSTLEAAQDKALELATTVSRELLPLTKDLYGSDADARRAASTLRKVATDLDAHVGMARRAERTRGQ